MLALLPWAGMGYLMKFGNLMRGYKEMIVSVTKQDFFYLVEKEGGKILSVPDDMENPDRQELEEYINSGGKISEAENSLTPTTSNYNWQGLAIAFKLSQLNQILTQLKDDGTNPQINPIWRISDELVQVITIPVFGESDRIAGMAQNIQALYEKLDEGGVEIPSSAKHEILDSLLANGFSSVVDILNV